MYLFVNLSGFAGATMSVELLVSGAVSKASKPLQQVDNTLIKVEWANRRLR